MKEVFVLQHTYGNEAKELENYKFIGVYSSYEEAEKAKSRLIKQPGFSNYPNGFITNCHILDKDDWAESFCIDNCVDIPA